MRPISRFLAAVAALSLVLTSCVNPFSPKTSPSSATGSISGRALFPNSTDSSGIFVTAEKTNGLRAAKGVVATASTAADGSYVLKGLDAGSWTLYAASKNSSEKAVTTDVVVTAGRAVTAADLHLTAVGKINGTVKLNDAEATTGNLGFLVSVAGTSYMALTNDAGAFEISDVPAGEGYLVVVSKDDYLAAWSTVTVSAGASAPMGKKTITSAQLKTTVAEIVWKGSLDAAPADPKANWAYYNTVDKKSYLWSAGEWQIMAQDGANGTNSGAGGSFAVTFNSNGGSAQSKLVTTSVGEEVLTVSKSNSALEGWYTTSTFAAGTKVSFPYVPTADTTLYAKWIPSTDGLSFRKLGTGYSLGRTSIDVSGAVVIPAYWQGKPVTAIDGMALETCFQVTSVSIPEGVTTIGALAFWRCKAMTSVTLPASLTSLGMGVFSDCDSLVSLSIPEGVTTIPESAFAATGLTTITLPASITSIGDSAFDYIPDNTLTITTNALTPPPIDRTLGTIPLAIKVPSASLQAYKDADIWKAFAASIVAL